MARRSISGRWKCGHEGCGEWSLHQYANQREYIAGERLHGGGKWRCVRHTKPEEVVSVENSRRETVLTVVEFEYGKFWNGTRGVVHGDGYNAYAADFPVGTRLKVTVELLPPE